MFVPLPPYLVNGSAWAGASLILNCFRIANRFSANTECDCYQCERMYRSEGKKFFGKVVDRGRIRR
jgi:hypothetical protein